MARSSRLESTDEVVLRHEFRPDRGLMDCCPRIGVRSDLPHSAASGRSGVDLWFAAPTECRPSWRGAAAATRSKAAWTLANAGRAALDVPDVECRTAVFDAPALSPPICGWQPNHPPTRRVVLWG